MKVDTKDLKSLPALAAEFGYLTAHTLEMAAKNGRLKAIKPARDWLSTAEWVREFHAKAGAGGKPRGSRKAGDERTKGE